MKRLLLLFALAVSSACAGDKTDVNYVQPGYVKKADLLGKSWYYRRTVVDSPEGFQDVGYATIGSGDLYTLERIRFDIQENFLIAYRDFDPVEGTAGPQSTPEFLGNPVVAFPITSHFDIARRYSAATGETTNVIEENVTDRPWYDRGFMRVEWERTLMSSQDYYLIAVDYLDNDGQDGGELYYHENDATNPWRARINPDGGYFDFVVLHRLQPHYGACYYAYGALGCGAGEVRVRHAFVQVDDAANAGYDPLNYPDSVPVLDASGKEVPDPVSGEVVREPVFERFGFYRLERLTYDDERGLTESGRLNSIIRFDLWKRSVDDNGQTIPYAQRETRPIVYHLNYDFPPALLDTARNVAAQWDDAFREAVAAIQGVSKDSVATMFELRENTCSVPTVADYLAGHRNVADSVRGAIDGQLDATTLANYCAATEYFSGGDFVWEQVGDPRFNMLVWVTSVTQTGWSGYGPMMADPTNGRIVTSNAFVSGWQIETSATRALQYIDYMNGDLSLRDLLAGADVPSLVNQTTQNYSAVQHTGSIESSQALALEHRASPEHMASLEQRFAVAEATDPLLTPLENPEYFDQRLARIRGTSIERDYLTSNESLMVASDGTWSRGQSATDELYNAASVVTRLRDGATQQRYRERLFDEHVFCNMEEVLDEGLVGLAKELAGLPREQRRDIIRSRIFAAVALHEIGHNIGLRHNFAASYDALNYGRTFWNLETSGADEQTKLEQKQPEYKYSSIMDYAGKVNGDFAGLGLYDRAAIKFAYGQVVETFNAASAPGGPELLAFREANDYRKLPQHLGSVDAIHDRSTRVWDWREPAQCSQSFLADLHAKEVPYMFCSDEFAQATPTCRRFDFGANASEQVEASYVRFKNYFIFTNFLRNRLQLRINSIINRSYSIYYDVLNTYQYMVLYRSRDPSFLSSDRGIDMASATARGLNALAELIAMPEPSTYYPCTATDGKIMSYPLGSIVYDPVVDPLTGAGPFGETCTMTTPMALALGDSQPLFLGFTEEYLDWTFSYLGTFWDKENAIFLLTQPSVRYLRVNGIEDYRSYSVSLYRAYRPEVSKLLEGLALYDYDAVASQVSGSEGLGTVTPLAIIDPTKPLGQGAVPDTTGPKVLPALARNLQREALLFGLARLTSPLDSTLDFGASARVWQAGAVDDLYSEAQWNAFPGSIKAECVPESSRVTYRALRSGEMSSDGRTHDVGYDLVMKCQQRVDAYNAADAAYDAAVTGGDERLISDALVARDRAELEMGAATQMLQFVRLVNSLYEHGIEL